MADQRPLVTWAVTTYNQSDCIEQAVASAFAQDYPNLEIIISDDCSTDDTFDKVERMAAAYSGRHRVRTNRNPTNLYIGGHISRINRLATGDLVINSAGDDTSDSRRASVITDAWLAADRRPGVIHSACFRVDGDHKTLFENPCLDRLTSIEEAMHCSTYITGATAAWDRRMFAHFGDLRGDLTHEDHAIAFRSLLMGRPIAFVAEPLVNHSHGGLSSYSTSLGAGERKTILGRYLADAEQKIADLAVIRRPDLEPRLRQLAAQYRAALGFESGWPSLAQAARWGADIGPLQLIRLYAKRALNQMRDRPPANHESQ